MVAYLSGTVYSATNLGTMNIPVGLYLLKEKEFRMESSRKHPITITIGPTQSLLHTFIFACLLVSHTDVTEKQACLNRRRPQRVILSKGRYQRHSESVTRCYMIAGMQ